MSDIESRNLDNTEIVNAAIFEKTQFLFKTRKEQIGWKGLSFFKSTCTIV